MAVYLSLNIQVQHDNNPAGLITVPLMPLTAWLLWWWNLRLVASHLVQDTRVLLNRFGELTASIYEDMLITGTVMNIGFKAMLFGVGMRV